MNIPIIIWKHPEVCGRQYYRDDPNNTLTNYEPFKFKNKITGKTAVNGNTAGVKIAAPLTYFSNFWSALEKSLNDCEIYLILNWSTDCGISCANGKTKFTATHTRLYVNNSRWCKTAWTIKIRF